MRPRLKSLIILLCLLPMNLYSAETIYSAAGRQDPLDNQGAAARPSALGSAFVAVSDDATAVLWNPAGLSSLVQSNVSIHHSTWFGTSQDVLVVGFPVRMVGGFGIVGSYVDYGSFEGTDTGGLSTGSFTSNQMSLGLGWGAKVLADLCVGASVKGVQQTLAEKSYSLFKGDVGALVTLRGGWKVGASYFNGALSKESLTSASAFRVGMSRCWRGKSGTSVLTAFSGNIEPRIGNSLQVGVEGTFNRSMAIRAGFDQRLRRKGYGGLAGLTAGVGLAFNVLQLDYAFVPYGDLGDSHRVSLGYRFGGPPKTTPTSTPTSTTTPLPTPVATVAAAAPPFQPLVAPQPAPVESPGTKSSITLEFELPADEVAPARQLVKEGRLAEAAKTYADVLRKNPQNAKAWSELGTLYYRAGQKEYALKCFEAVVKLRPNDKALAEWLEKYKNQP